MRFAMAAAYGTTYNNDICINKSDSAFNGKYFPHGVLTFNGLNDDDEIINGKLIRRSGDRDFADLTFSASNGRFFAQITDAPSSNTLGGVFKAALPYIHVNGGTAMAENKSIGFGQSNNYIYVYDTSYASVSAFNDDMQVKHPHIVYKLATPETYELVSPIPTAMPSGTTERRLPEDTSDSVLAPFACDMTYGTNPGDILASGVAWERIWGRPQLAKGSYTDSVITGSGEWFKLDVGGQELYVQFAVGTGAFRLKIADSDDEDAATVSKEFAFATLSTTDIDAICV